MRTYSRGLSRISAAKKSVSGAFALILIDQVADLLNKHCQQHSLPPGWLLKHLDITTALLFVKVNLPSDLHKFGVCGRVGFVVRVMMDSAKDFPCFGRTILQAEVSRRLCQIVNEELGLYVGRWHTWNEWEADQEEKWSDHGHCEWDTDLNVESCSIICTDGHPCTASRGSANG
jgi:hypothetical protein